MTTITLKELRNTLGKVAKVVATGKVVRVTSRGKPLFDIVPGSPHYGLANFFKKLDAVGKNYPGIALKEVTARLEDGRERKFMADEGKI